MRFVLILKTTKTTHPQSVSIVLTGAIEARRDGVQKGVLRGQEALHHWHLDPDVGRPTAGCRSHHPRNKAGGAAGAGHFEGDSPALVAGMHIYSKISHLFLQETPLPKTKETKIANNAELQVCRTRQFKSSLLSQQGEIKSR